MSTIPCTFTREATDEQITQLDGFLARKRDRDLERAREKVRFWLARAAEAQETGLAHLVPEYLRCAEYWQETADELEARHAS